MNEQEWACHYLMSDWAEFGMKDARRSFLQAFQRRNKYLLMAAIPAKQKELGRIASNSSNRIDYEQYESLLLDALAVTPLSRGAYRNALQHMFGYVSEQLDKEETERFLLLVEQYSNGTLSLQKPLQKLQLWASDLSQSYLLEQTIFTYPHLYHSHAE
ncbi:DUF1722 domain-containing protein [Paenibacillus chungangensis]|uniref:DUF1722 domain-containing protein n=1 Tax=Paenibacillus chungangensis TaxID=696535 RepID=A0ABW3HTZ1_9BACL